MNSNKLFLLSCAPYHDKKMLLHIVHSLNWEVLNSFYFSKIRFANTWGKVIFGMISLAEVFLSY